MSELSGGDDFWRTGGLIDVGQWAPALTGYAGINLVMFSGARRLEVRQNKNNGKNLEYQKYVKTIPILLAFVPLYKRGEI